MVELNENYFNIEKINNYLQSSGIKLSAKENETLNTIFENSDKIDDATKSNGKDGILNNEEWDEFIREIKTNIPRIFKTMLNLDNKQAAQSKVEIEQTKFAAADATRVEKPPIKLATKIDKIQKTEHTKEIIAKKLYLKWSKKLPDSKLNVSFYEKLYDVIDILKIKIPENQWNKGKYASPKEQALDEIIAIFAGESRLKTNAKNGNQYYGLFQLSKVGLTEIKQYAKKHPNEPGMNNISQKMTLSKFTTISGEEQLDYLIAFISKNKEYSKIGKNETITPAQLWAMIKLPFKGKHINTIKQKEKAIKNVFVYNKVPIGLS